MDPMFIVAGALLVLGVGGLAALYFTVPSVKQWFNTHAKEAVLRTMREYIVQNVIVIVQKEYKVIAAKVMSGELKTKEQVKAELYRLGVQLKDKVIKQFAGKDLALLGGEVDGLIDDLIRYAVDRVSPFPGKDTAEAFLTEGVSDQIVDKGVDWVQQNFLAPALSEAKKES